MWGEGEKENSPCARLGGGLKALPADPSVGLIGHPGASLLIRHLFALLPSAKRFVCVAASSPQDRPPSSDKEMEAQKVGSLLGGHTAEPGFAPWFSGSSSHPFAASPCGWRVLGAGSRRSSFPPTAQSRPRDTWVQTHGCRRTASSSGSATSYLGDFGEVAYWADSVTLPIKQE